MAIFIKFELKILSHPNIFSLMIESGVRGGITTILHRYEKANNTYTGTEFNNDAGSEQTVEFFLA